MTKPSPAPSPIVTFPLHVQRDLWERFKDRLDKGQSAHGTLIAYIEAIAAGKPPRRRRPRRA